MYQVSGQFRDPNQTSRVGSGPVGSGKGDPTRSARIWKPPDPIRANPTRPVIFRTLPEPIRGVFSYGEHNAGGHGGVCEVGGAATHVISSGSRSLPWVFLCLLPGMHTGGGGCA